MIIYRCQNCGEKTGTADRDNNLDYFEEWDTEPHRKCKQKPDPAVEKLRQAILGR